VRSLCGTSATAGRKGISALFDYWQPIIRNRMARGSVHVLLIQYILPTAGVPDLVMAIARNRAPVLSPLTV